MLDSPDKSTFNDQTLQETPDFGQKERNRICSITERKIRKFDQLNLAETKSQHHQKHEKQNSHLNQEKEKLIEIAQQRKVQLNRKQQNKLVKQNISNGQVDQNCVEMQSKIKLAKRNSGSRASNVMDIGFETNKRIRTDMKQNQAEEKIIQKYKNQQEEDKSEESFEIDEDDCEGEFEEGEKKKDKKLVFLSRSVLEKIREKPMTTGTQIANEILELYKQFSEVSYTQSQCLTQKVDFKNVQRRVYDALNVLNAMEIIKKDKNQIFFNSKNTLVPIETNNSIKSSLKLQITEDFIKLMDRNFDQSMRQIQRLKAEEHESPKSEQAMTTAEERTQTESHPGSTEKLFLPLLLIQESKNGSIELKTDPNYQSVQIFSDKKLRIINENHLLKALGFTKVREDDISSIFSEELTQFMRNQEFVSTHHTQQQIHQEEKNEKIQLNAQAKKQLQPLKIQQQLQGISNKFKKFSPKIISSESAQIQYHRSHSCFMSNEQNKGNLTGSFSQIRQNLQENKINNKTNQSFQPREQQKNNLSFLEYPFQNLKGEQGFRPHQKSLFRQKSMDEGNNENSDIFSSNQNSAKINIHIKQIPSKIYNLTSPYRDQFQHNSNLIEGSFYNLNGNNLYSEGSSAVFNRESSFQEQNNQACILNSQELQFLPQSYHQ
ncbi:transcription factor-like protein dpb-like [Stylonychia lemnae]|uniref:Transcription factor-like protein dpb-like n=1 Tax=Stylonychia lemnae TaxID=5949 RepID=A0A078AEV8_STYLE|nr:transcription factor-like protein dpb-like [Stylonychia lemnae]|eukprot:CDW80804.1 transcription factor-like protein dpb-like [Stylonychia lemnae]